MTSLILKDMTKECHSAQASHHYGVESRKGQMYTALYPTCRETISMFQTHDARVKMKQPYHNAKAFPLILENMIHSFQHFFHFFFRLRVGDLPKVNYQCSNTWRCTIQELNTTTTKKRTQFSTSQFFISCFFQ